MKDSSGGVNTPTPNVNIPIKSLPNKSKSGGGAGGMAGKMNTSNSIIKSGIASAIKTIKGAKP